MVGFHINQKELLVEFLDGIFGVAIVPQLIFLLLGIVASSPPHLLRTTSGVAENLESCYCRAASFLASQKGQTLS